MASPLVEQFRKGGVSREVRLTAASGALPLTPLDQTELLYLLSRDIDEEVRATAEASLLALPAEDVEAVVKDVSAHAKVLDFYGRRLESPVALQSIIQNVATEDVTMVELAGRVGRELLELIVINQTRLLRHPPVLKRLETNPHLSPDQKRRILELKHDFKLDAQPPTASTAAADHFVDLASGPPEEDAPVSAEDAIAIYSDGHHDAPLSEMEQQLAETLLQRIVKMNASEKMIEALRGEREARMMLIHDRNRVVYSAVLASPKITDAEVDAFAAMKNVSPEVLRIVGSKREWTKRYGVAHELVRNPLTPIEISMKLISRLSARDLKRLTGDRNVPEAVRRQATKLTRSEK